MNKKKDFAPFISSLVAIVCGLVIGFIILCISNPNEALAGFATILSGPITHGMNGIGQVLYYATPLILCGLSVGFAFKTGLFNIGGSGQFLMGAFGGVLIGLTCPKLGPFQWVVALLVATLFGALWGAIPGLLKAYFNVNEVITCILLNYVSLFWVNMTVKGSKALFNTLRNESKDIPKVATLPKLGLDVVFDGASVNAGIIIAILAAILLYIILEKTTFGYELKACGLNKTASKYAGINENRSIVYSMVIAGAIAGLAGGIMLLSGTGRHIEIKDVIPNEGFNGISVALLGVSNPIGVIFSGLFIAYLSAGGFYLQLFHFSKEIIDIIVAVIIYFSAFALIIKKILANIERKKLDKNERQTSDVNNKSVSVTKKGV